MWKSVVGYEGFYEVSDDGLVRSIDRHIVCRDGTVIFRKGKMLSIVENQHRDDGYCVVNLRKPGSSKTQSVHVLVANAFIPNPNHFPTVNHKDGNKKKNHVDNLEWATYGENNVHALHNGLRHPRGNPVAQLKDGILINKYKSMIEASRQTGISYGMISHCIHGRSKSAGGYEWKPYSEGVTTIPNGSTPEDELPAEAQEQRKLKI